jgi:hypothetical protein
MTIDEAYEIWDILTHENDNGDCLSSLRYYGSQFGWSRSQQKSIYKAVESGECSDYLVEVLDDQCFDKNGFLIQ